MGSASFQSGAGWRYQGRRRVRTSYGRAKGPPTAAARNVLRETRVDINTALYLRPGRHSTEIRNPTSEILSVVLMMNTEYGRSNDRHSSGPGSFADDRVQSLAQSHGHQRRNPHAGHEASS